MEASDARLCEFLEGVREAVLTQLGNGNPSLRRAAEATGASVRTLQRRFDAVGVTFRDLVAEQRLEVASRLLRETGLSVAVIATAVGYSDATAFSRAFRRRIGQAPSDFRQARNTARVAAAKAVTRPGIRPEAPAGAPSKLSRAGAQSPTTTRDLGAVATKGRRRAVSADEHSRHGERVTGPRTHELGAP